MASGKGVTMITERNPDVDRADHSGTKAAIVAILVLFAIPHTILALAMAWGTIRSWNTDPEPSRALLTASFALLGVLMWTVAVMLSKGKCAPQQGAICRVGSFVGAVALVVYAVAGAAWVSRSNWDEMTTMILVISVVIPLLEAATLAEAGLLLKQDSPGAHWHMPSSLPPMLPT
jgi:hypothetical protein